MRARDPTPMPFHISQSGIALASSSPDGQKEGASPSPQVSSPTRSVFLCHAAEDKPDLVRPFAQALEAGGLSFWLDEAEIGWGDNITKKIGEGLASSEFVVVFLSEHFLRKNWPQTELANALSEETTSGRVKVLPVLLADEDQVFRRYPLLRDKLYMRWSDGIEAILNALAARIRSTTAATSSVGGGVQGPNKANRADETDGGS